MPWPPSSTPRWSFPPSARRGLGKEGNEALKLDFSLFGNINGQWALCSVYKTLLLNMNVYMIVPFKISFIFLVVTFSLCRPDLDSVGSGELLVRASEPKSFPFR